MEIRKSKSSIGLNRQRPPDGMWDQTPKSRFESRILDWTGCRRFSVQFKGFDFRISNAGLSNFQFLLSPLLPQFVHDPLLLLNDPFFGSPPRNGVVGGIHEHVARNQRKLLFDEAVLLMLDESIVGVSL